MGEGVLDETNRLMAVASMFAMGCFRCSGKAHDGTVACASGCVRKRDEITSEETARPYSSSGASLQTRRPIDWSNLVYVKAFQPMLGLANEVASQPVGKPDHEDSSEGEKE